MSKKITVMLIDDNRIDLFIHNAFIKQMNIAHAVLEYSFAKDAITFLQNSESSNWPELILLDIHMPIMNGFDFLDEYLVLPENSRNKCKIVIVSSSLDTGDRQKAKSNPLVIDLFEKPLNREKLLELLKQQKVI